MHPKVKEPRKVEKQSKEDEEAAQKERERKQAERRKRQIEFQRSRQEEKVGETSFMTGSLDVPCMCSLICLYEI